MQERFFLSMVLLSLHISNFPFAPAGLKHSYAIFNEGYQHLSSLQGALLWESGVVKNYYDAGVAAAIPAGTWLPRADGPVQLARALFTDTLGSFDVSSNPNYPAKHLGIATLASLVALLELNKPEAGPLDAHFVENFIICDPEFVQSVSATNCERKVIKETYETLIGKAALLGQKDQVAQLQYSSTMALNKLDTQRLYKNWTRCQNIAQIKARIADLDELKGVEKVKAQKERAQKERALTSLETAKEGGDYNRVYELAQAIVNAHTSSQYYHGHCAQWILLAALYRKAKNKHDIAYFITLLSQKLGSHICRPLEKDWDSMTYTTADYDVIKQHVLSCPELALSDSIPSAFYEGVAYAQIMERYYKGPFPKMSEYLNVPIAGIVFPDCMEVTLFNFCNMVLYDRRSGVFDLKQVSTPRPSQMLIEFYQDEVCKQACNIGLLAVHQSWDTMLQNWPLVTYRKCIVSNTDGSKAILTASKDTNGFIYGLSEKLLDGLEREGERVLIGDRWYMYVADPHAYLCEMHPTIRNVILVLTRLFNLDLFSHDHIEPAFLSHTFNAYYFPRLCECFSLLKGMQWTDSLLAALDKNEYTEHGITLSFIHFDLLLTNEHAEIIMSSRGDSIADIGPQLAKLALQNPAMGQLLTIFPCNAEDFSGVDLYRYLLYLPLQNNQIKIKTMLFCIQKILDQHVSEQDRIYLIDRVTSFMRQLPERLDWHYHEELILNIDKRAFALEFIRREFERILSIAKSRLTGVAADCEYVPSLYLALVAQGQQREDVMLVIDNLVARHEPFDRKPLLNLLIEMAKQGKAIVQAGKVVEQCINNTVPAERALAVILRDILPK